jgi:lysophospholipase L1-like esterase
MSYLTVKKNDILSTTGKLAVTQRMVLFRNLNECIFDLSPSKIFINIGTNDLNFPNYDENNLIANYEKILAQIKNRHPSTKVYILSFYPINADVASNIKNEIIMGIFKTRTNQAIKSANLRLKDMSKEFGYDFIDLYPLLLDSRGNLDKQYTTEGIHLKPNAYQLILKKLVPYFS